MRARVPVRNALAIGGFHKVLVHRTWWSVIQKNIIRIKFESHYLTSICHCVISSWDLVKPKNITKIFLNEMCKNIPIPGILMPCK